MVELKRVWFIEPVMIEKNICEDYRGDTISLNTSLINYPVIVIEINETAYRIPLSNVKSFTIKKATTDSLYGWHNQTEHKSDQSPRVKDSTKSHARAK